MKAIIMAGGKGSRLRPLTCDLPKPMVPVAGKPMMEHIVELLQHHQFKEVGVTLCYLPERIRDHFGDGKQFGVSMTYFMEDKPLGTAGSVRNAADFLDDTFLVISGDALTDFDLNSAVEFHRSRNATATLVLTRVEVPLEYGVVVTSEDGRVQRFLEKPGWSQVFSDTVNTGIYVLEPEIFDYFEADKEFDFAKDLFPLLLADSKPVYGYIADGYWSDVGNIEVYRQTHIDVMDGRVRVNIPGREISDRVWVGNGVRLPADVIVEGPAIIGDNCVIGERAVIGAYTCLGRNCVLGSDVTVKRSVLWDGVHVESASELRGTILADGARLASRVKAFEGSVVGRQSCVGANTSLHPSVKIWPEKDIADDVQLTSNVIWTPTVTKSIFGFEGIYGDINIDLTPEMAAKAGAALGTSLPLNSEVAVGADGSTAAQMLKRAFMSGLASSGISAVDLGTSTVPMIRFAALSRAGGVHIKQRETGSSRAVISLFDEKGLPFSRSKQRGIEGQFYREEFRRVGQDQIGKTKYEPGVAAAYMNWILDRFAGAEERAGYKESDKKPLVVADAGSGAVSLILSTFLRELGCQVIEVDNYGSGYAEKSPSRAKLLQASVRRSEADLGLLVTSDGTKASIVDDEGKLVREEEFWPLVAYVLMKLGQKDIAVPVYAPAAVEDIAKMSGSHVNRPGDIEKVIKESVVSDDGAVHPDLYFDAVAFAGGIVHVILRETRLSEVLRQLPAATYLTRIVKCPWEQKGRVMRTLIDGTKDLPRELIDGVKVFHEEGWALVLPDGESPYVRIYCEASDLEAADQLAALYEAKINEIRK